MHNFEPYTKRPVKFLQQVSSKGWKIKVYAISVKTEPLAKELVSNGIKAIISHLPQPALTENRYGVGFMIIHQGAMRNWFLLDWWEQEDIMHHRLFSSPLDNPDAISAESDSSLIACVHELRVIAFESEAWIKTVLSKDNKANFDDYLQLKFDDSGVLT